jgi:phosphatidyl-myo-inositol dimannoside synthase
MLGGGAPPPPPPAGDFRARHGLPEGPLLLSVGRLVPRKGYAEFIARALPAVLQRFPAATYAIVGAEAAQAASPVAGMRAQIEAAADAAGVAGAVRLLGALSDEDLAAAYAAADVLVFPSHGAAGDVEGFGMVLLEAAAHGTPAVAFDTGGVGDAVGPGSGLLVPAGDFPRFAGAVAGLLAGEAPDVSAQACRRHAGASGWPRFAGRVRDIARAAECPQ